MPKVESELKEPIKTDIDTKAEPAIRVSKGILLNRKDLRNDPDQIMAVEKAERDLKEAEMANDEGIRRMFYGTEPELPGWVIDALRKSKKNAPQEEESDDGTWRTQSEELDKEPLK